MPALPAAKGTPTLDAAAATAEQPGLTSACPHCGNPVRSGAKFCSSCGRVIEQPTGSVVEKGQATQQGKGSVSEPALAGQDRPTTSAPTRRTESTAPTLVSPTAPLSEGRAMPVRKHIPWITLIMAGVIVLCLAVFAVGGLIYLNPFGISGKTPGKPVTAVQTTTSPVVAVTSAASAASPQPAATQPPIVNTDTARPSPASTMLPTATAMVIQPTVMLPPPASETPVLSLTATLQLPQPTGMIPEATLVATAVVSTVATLPQPQLSVTILEDNFKDGLNLNWFTWGVPLPTIDRGPTSDWMYLKAVERSDAAGASSKPKTPIPSKAGTQIEFSASLDRIFPEAPLIFDWSLIGNGPTAVETGAESGNSVYHLDKGMVHLEIYRNNLLILNPPTNKSCEKAINGLALHSYILRFLPGPGVELYVDGEAEPVCQIVELGIDQKPGLITFSGAGWVTYVRVMAP
jgi:hypothetical protein